MVKPVLRKYVQADKDVPSVDLIAIMSAVLSKGSAFRFRARGFSMFPFIHNEDLLTIKSISKGYLGLGRVVAFTQTDYKKLVVHRIVGKKGMDFFIQGDHMDAKSAEWVSSAEIIGYVSRVERNGKRVRWGLGPERVLIALLSRMGIWSHLRI